MSTFIYPRGPFIQSLASHTRSQLPSTHVKNNFRVKVSLHIVRAFKTMTLPIFRLGSEDASASNLELDGCTG